MIELALSAAERGAIPDSLVRFGIRRLLKRRLQDIRSHSVESFSKNLSEFAADMLLAPIAVQAEKANEQHYEVPIAFFEKVLGSKLKYSCALWESDQETLDDAEIAALQDTCKFAQLHNGQKILELGCGWGSLSLWMAEQYPESSILAVSNSFSQAKFINQRILELGLTNITVVTQDMNDFEAQLGYFDRVVSVEMFEHMRNYTRLYAKISDWLVHDGIFFKHIFVHRQVPYLFKIEGGNDWMSKYFFSGGMMPSFDLPLMHQSHLHFLDRQGWDGMHYSKTSNAWLDKMDRHRLDLIPLIKEVYGEEVGLIWWHRWRIFFMACAELFGFRNGQEWWVAHYIFVKKG